MALNHSEGARDPCPGCGSHILEPGVPTTFGKLILALGATALIGAAALAPTAASAWSHGHGGHWGHGFGFGIYAPIFVAAPDCYVVDRVVETRIGLVLRSFTVCD
jgi:hypothetical protein